MPGAGLIGLHYWNIHDQVSHFTTSVLYDRAGTGWSDYVDLPRSAAEVTDELRSLLHVALVPAPYLLVGHSLGGFYVRRYAQRFPDEVAGLLFLDPAHEDYPAHAPTQTRLGTLQTAVSLVRVLVQFKRFCRRRFEGCSLSGRTRSTRTVQTPWCKRSGTYSSRARTGRSNCGLDGWIGSTSVESVPDASRNEPIRLNRLRVKCPKTAEPSSVPSSGRHASAQVGHSPQAQALGDFSKALPAGREEIAIIRPNWCEVRNSPPRREDRQEIRRSRSSIINHAIDAVYSLRLPFPSRSWRVRATETGTHRVSGQGNRDPDGFRFSFVWHCHSRLDGS
ncbi:MAG: alpha/beta fold hydrolase [Isosphaeraceae bacterium]